MFKIVKIVWEILGEVLSSEQFTLLYHIPFAAGYYLRQFRFSTLLNGCALPALQPRGDKPSSDREFMMN